MATKVSFTTLQQGSSGPAVTKLQQRLKNLSFYAGTVDGQFGPNTKNAVSKFQQNNGLKSDGVVGYVTESTIERAIWVSQRQTIQEGSQGKDVELLQNLLNRADDINKNQGPIWNVPGGFGVGRQDGKFGAKVKAAVIKFQQAEKLTADGVVGAKTWQKLSGIVTFDLEPQTIVDNNVFDLA